MRAEIDAEPAGKFYISLMGNFSSKKVALHESVHLNALWLSSRRLQTLRRSLHAGSHRKGYPVFSPYYFSMSWYNRAKKSLWVGIRLAIKK